ncbi:MAG: hypothetical protein IJ658_06170 [Kiritimatiellae bacterium]|nr:hypothetical protein [Kiritimatiellia bacterium]
MIREFMCSATIAIAAFAASASVFDDARVWWRFDNGGADGAVVQKNEIHDARDATAAVPTQLYGAQGGPLWSRMDVRLPTQRRTVGSTALYLPCETRYTTTNQFFQANMLFDGIQVDSKEVSVVTRVMFDGNDVVSADAVLFNNGYNWTDYVSQAFGFKKGSATRGPGTIYYPYMFVARTYPGGSAMKLAMSVGQWYDVAYTIRLGEDGTNYVTFVVSGDGGLRQQSVALASNYASGPAKTYTRVGAMGTRTGWSDYSPVISQNSADVYKNFSGWVHQLAVWDRVLTIDEIKEAFGTAEPNVGDAYADAVHWWRFDRDINGDGVMQTNEFRDVRFWGGTGADAYARAHIVPTETNGFFGGPLWTNASVYLPGRGVTVQSPCLHFPAVVNVTTNADDEEIHSVRATWVDVPRAAIAGSQTVIARICPALLPGVRSNNIGYFYNNGLNWGDWSGYEVGLARNGSDTSGTNLVPAITIARSTYYFTGLPVWSDEWCDIAFSITDAGTDAEGNDLPDSVTAVVCDRGRGFRSQTISIASNAYTSYGTFTQIRFGAETGQDVFNDFWNATTQTRINNGNYAKCFNGLIHQVATWDRALTVDEIAAAFGHPNNMVMGVGVADGTSGEFAAAGEGSRDWTLGEAWHDMAASVDAAHPDLTIRFTPDTNNLQLVHVLHLKTAAVGTGAQKALLTLNLNGKALASAKQVGSNDDLWAIVPKRLLANGENALTISYKGGPAPSVAIDKVEIGGSWQLGVDDGVNHEFAQEGSGRGVHYYVGNRNLLNMIRSTTSSTRDSYIHFYLPPEIATNHAYTFTSRYNDESSPAVNTNSFRILLNGVEKYRSPVQGLNKNDGIAFEVGKGELLPGWNTLNQQFLDSVGWMTFDFFQLGISDYTPGTFLIAR